MSQTPRPIGGVKTSPQIREGNGFPVRRPLGSLESYDTIDPFVMLDHIGPTEYQPGEAVGGSPDHPHRGIETVTYILSGGMHYKDRQGNQGDLRPGWIQWLTAGNGVIHSETPSENLRTKGGVMEGFQLWVSLPAGDQLIKPSIQDIPPEQIPKGFTDESQRTKISVIAGSSHSINSTIQTKTPMLFLDVHFLHPDATFSQQISSNFRGLIYVYRGSLVCETTGKEVSFGQVAPIGKEGELLQFRNNFKNIKGDAHPLAGHPTKFLLISGQFISEPASFETEVIFTLIFTFTLFFLLIRSC